MIQIENPKEIHFVFEMLTIGELGDVFALGTVLLDKNANVLRDTWYAVNPSVVTGGTEEEYAYVQETIAPQITEFTDSLGSMRDQFWSDWMVAKSHGADAWTRHMNLSKARFISQCIDGSRDSRKKNAPYVQDIDTLIRFTGGKQKVESWIDEHPRLEHETQHNPLGEAHYSARIMQACWSNFFGTLDG